MSETRPDGVDAPRPGLMPSGPTPSGRKRPVSIPWREIARRLAEGARPAVIAGDLGLEEDRIWRHLRRSLRFRFYLRQAMERQRLLAGLQLAALGQTALLSRGLKPDSLDSDLLRLLNEAAPDGDVGQQIETLGKTGEAPPNMAFRARLAAERRVMDAEVAETCRLMAAAANAREAARTATNPGEPERTQTNPNEPQRTETNLYEPERTPRPRPPQSVSRPPAEPPTPPIVDLDGPDLARLRAQGLLGAPRPPDS